MAYSNGPKIVTDGLVLCLDAANSKSYPGTGTAWNDLSGNGNNGTLTNGTTFSADNGGVLSFDGSNDYISLASPSDRYAWTPSGNGNNYITIDIWVKSTDGGHFFSKPWNGSGAYNYRITNNTFLLVAAQSNSKTFSNLSTGNWENATVVVNPTQFAVYRNGSINSSFSNHNITGNTPGVGNLNLPLALMTLYPYGVWGGNTGFSILGQLGIFKFYNRVLSPNEVQQNYNALKGRYGLT